MRHCPHDFLKQQIMVVEHYDQPWIFVFEGAAPETGDAGEADLTERAEVLCQCGREWSGNRYSRSVPRWVRRALDAIARGRAVAPVSEEGE